MESRHGATRRSSRPAQRLVRGWLRSRWPAAPPVSRALSLALVAAPPAAAATVTPSLIVSNYTGQSILTFPLSATGNVAPATTITTNGTTTPDPTATAFNGAGDLWVVSDTTITEYTPGAAGVLG